MRMSRVSRRKVVRVSVARMAREIWKVSEAVTRRGLNVERVVVVVFVVLVIRSTSSLFVRELATLPVVAISGLSCPVGSAMPARPGGQPSRSRLLVGEEP